VGADTVQRPGGDAAVVRVHGSKKALAITTDCTPRYCYADPVEGGKQAVAEAYRNLCAVGAKPLAITNCLNFGNPERPEIMGQFVGCIEGIAEACRVLDFPVVSGNVSLYNETKNDDGTSTAILPTPAIGGVGLLDEWEKSATIALKVEGSLLATISDGTLDDGFTRGHLGQSLWLRETKDETRGPPPAVDLEAESKAGRFVRSLIAEGKVTAVHDVSDGGLLVAAAEMALAGNLGIAINSELLQEAIDLLFGEDQGRYLVEVRAAEFEPLVYAASAAGLSARCVGQVGGDRLIEDRLSPQELKLDLSLADLRAAHEGFFPKLMGSELTPEF
ncbi:MAG TPA: AIR synthase related protein, partial [Sphingomicrobium sp.]|nr:AIR synthase related protein [Sphingomicrobium sp.]